MQNDCTVVEIEETKLTNFDFMRNEVLQNNLAHFLEIFDCKFL